jgi:hypothetical protein
MNVRPPSWLLIVVAALLTACSSGSDLPSAAPLAAPAAPTPEKAIAGARAAATAEKLIDPIEFSAALQGKSLSAGDYMLCIRGARSPSEPRLTFAVFFYNGEYKDVRPSVILDACETQAYSPLPAAAAPAKKRRATR